MSTVEHLEAVDAALLAIAEARDRAEEVMRVLQATPGDGDGRVVEAVKQAERSLLETHNELRRSAYFPAVTAKQLSLT